MALPILVNVQLAGNQVLGLRLETLAADPTGPALYEGRLWFNSTDNYAKYYDGASIIPIGAPGASGVMTLTVDNLTIENIGTATNPSIRVKAGGIGNAQIAGPIDFGKLATPTADFSLGGFKIINLATPTAATDGATKGYVDAVAGGLSPKQPVRAATTANLASVAGLLTIDGVTLVDGDRVLVKNQTAPAQNGIYVASAVAWTRSTDADTGPELLGAQTFVSEGTVNGNTLWVMTADAPIVVGTTGLPWYQFGGPGEYTAGTGLVLTGTQFALVVPVSVANGGTGATTAAGARANLGTVGKVTQVIGDGVATTYPITHNLGTLDVVVEVFESATGTTVLTDVVRASTNVVNVVFSTPPASNSIRVVIVG